MIQKNNFKHIRDPIYGFIGISKKEERIIQTPIFQRLRRIKQLSNTHLVYPGAVHTRFEHSLGTLHLAGLVADKLNLPKNEKRILRLAALLHDVGQGPFSHLFETPMKWANGNKHTHEKTTQVIIEHDKDIAKILRNDLDGVLKILTDNNGFLYKIISSDLDIDKMDYFRRDSHHIGVTYGTYDFERVILTLCKISRFGENYFGITEKGMRAVESYRLARFNLWEQVYEHHTRKAADYMMLNALKAFSEEYEPLLINLTTIVDDNADFCRYFATLDDYSLQHKILIHSKGKAKEIIKNIRARKLLKRAFRIHIDKIGIPDAILREKLAYMSIEEKEKNVLNISRQAGISPEDLIIYIQNIAVTGYGVVEDTNVSERILVKMRNGKIRALNEISPLTLQDSTIRRLYVFGPPKKQTLKKIREICERIFQVKSDFS